MESNVVKQPQSAFLRIAPEIRALIYKQVLGGLAIRAWQSIEGDEPQIIDAFDKDERYIMVDLHSRMNDLFLVCRQVYEEARPVPFNSNIIAMGLPDINDFTQRLNTIQQSSITNVEIGFNISCAFNFLDPILKANKEPVYFYAHSQHAAMHPRYKKAHFGYLKKLTGLVGIDFKVFGAHALGESKLNAIAAAQTILSYDLLEVFGPHLLIVTFEAVESDPEGDDNSEVGEELFLSTDSLVKQEDSKAAVVKK